MEERIPKVIHYFWFGKGKKPKIFEKCLKSWKEKCPDYEIKEWTEDDFDGYRNFLIDLFYDCFYVNQKETDKKISKEKNEKDLRNIEKQYYDTILGK